MTPDMEARQYDALQSLECIAEMLGQQNSMAMLRPEPLAALLRVVTEATREALPHRQHPGVKGANDRFEDLPCR